jgi:hypothetical protein
VPSLAAVTILSFAWSAADRLLGTLSYFISWPLSFLFFFNYRLRVLNTKCSSKLDLISFSPPAFGECYISLLKCLDLLAY